MDDKKKTEHPKERRPRTVPAVSARLPDGTVVELLYRAQEQKTLFAVAHGGEVREAQHLELPDGRLLVPYSARNNLITHRAILLPSEAAEYQSEAQLRALVRGFIHRYVDLSPDFEEVATHYVLLSWRYDDFADLPYLRVLGDYGSGKSRFLTTVGSLVYRPIFASGASTVSPLFRILDAVGGTLVLDEGDFRFSDEKAEITKILNNGNSKGFPVLRTEATPSGEFNPRAFTVFGPKLIATRKQFDDPALESRCITAHLGKGEVRPDIPVNLPPEFHEEALCLRNQLLLYRLREAGRVDAPNPETLRLLEPRVAQVFSSLVASVEDEGGRARLLAVARTASANLMNLRSDSVEADVVAAALGLWERSHSAIAVKEIARKVWEGEGGAPLSPRAVGGILRRLGLSPRKRQGNYVLPGEEMEHLTLLAKRYNVMPGAITPQVDIVDVVDEGEEARPAELT
jgi:hypothetical protein